MIRAHACPLVVNHRRGTAEIELLLVIPVLITILLLSALAYNLGSARLVNVWNAENQAYTQIETGQLSPFSANLPAPDGFSAIRPGLPNRMVVAQPQTNVKLGVGNLNLSPVLLVDQAAFLDPSWNYGGAPHFQDRAQNDAWLADYFAESHPGALVVGLGLAPPDVP